MAGGGVAARHWVVVRRIWDLLALFLVVLRLLPASRVTTTTSSPTTTAPFKRNIFSQILADHQSETMVVMAQHLLAAADRYGLDVLWRFRSSRLSFSSLPVGESVAIAYYGKSSCNVWSLHEDATNI